MVNFFLFKSLFIFTRYEFYHFISHWVMFLQLPISRHRMTVGKICDDKLALGWHQFSNNMKQRERKKNCVCKEFFIFRCSIVSRMRRNSWSPHPEALHTILDKELLVETSKYTFICHEHGHKIKTGSGHNKKKESK